MSTHFTKLNDDWNAEPNAPDPVVLVSGDRLVLEFTLNGFVFEQFEDDQRGRLIFDGVCRYRLGRTNDEGWYRGLCRFSRLAPGWGEFYEITGDLLLEKSPADWVVLAPPTATPDLRHFLFYLRDETFECQAKRWEFQSSIEDQEAG